MTTEEFDTALSDLETKVDRLRALYENWFRGYEKSEPSVARKEVERRVYQLRKELPRNTALRFRYHQLYQRFTTLTTYWQRTSRQIEEGTYKLQLTRLKRRNEQRRPGQRRAPREGEEEKDEPHSYELDLDESLSVGDLLDEAELDEVGRALDAPGPHSEPPPKPSPAASAGVFGRPGGTGTLPKPAPLPAAPAPQPRSAQAAAPAPAAPAPAAPPAAAPAQAKATTPGVFARPAAPAPFGGAPGTGKLPAPPPPAARVPAPPVPAAGAARPAPPGGAAAPARPGQPAGHIPQGATLPGVGRPVPPAPPLPATRAPEPVASPPAARPPVPAVPPVRPAPPVASPARAAQPAAASRPEPRAPAPSAPIAASSTFVGRPPIASPIAGSPAPNEQRLKRIYDEYTAARRRNNEGEIRYEALVSSIQKMLPELSKKHQGKQIDFDVVVKDGRVGLKPKAT